MPRQAVDTKTFVCITKLSSAFLSWPVLCSRLIPLALEGLAIATQQEGAKPEANNP